MIDGVPQQDHIKESTEAFQQAFAYNLYYTRGQAVQTASLNDMYTALAYTVRDHLVDRWLHTVDRYYEENPKFVCYLSAEYLLGRHLQQNMLYMGIEEIARKALADFGIDIDKLLALDVEPGLGNGGLGRLAACFLDSMATLSIPCIAYGIRYEYGIFRQSFENGWQIESPDEWLLQGNPWEFPQPDNIVEVQFGGRTEHYTDEEGRYRVRWVADRRVLGMPYHTLVPGYQTGTVNMLRLWSARASEEFDFQLFNEGDYMRAVEEKIHSETLSKVLYPNDNTREGKELRLKQQYFFVACSLNDIIRRFHIRNEDWDLFPEKVVIQLNDTHPVVAIPELMRLLVDNYLLSWENAWRLTQRTFAYTCHTLLPEALETWPVDLFGRLLPRHLDIIYEINRRFLDEVKRRFPGDNERLARMSIIAEWPEKQVRMANLAAVGSFSINGVAELQTHLLGERVLHDFHAMWPEKFNNKTNGVTPRRFMKLANPALSDLITSKIGDGWLTDLEQLRGLEEHVEDPEFCRAWREVKQLNKRRLAAYILDRTGIDVDPESIFDVMVKRLHQYKRQHLKALHIITLYNRLKARPSMDIVPQTFIFGAKAAPGYHMAKRIIKLINAIGTVVNNDPDVRGRLKVVFLENFNVTLGELIYPAANISEQVSMAGKEASGTGNMKFALNGAVTVGTLDGANVEIRERVGADNFFLFGLTAKEVFALKEQGYNPRSYYETQPELKHALDRIVAGDFSNGDRELFKPITDTLLDYDPFLVLADYLSYIGCQSQASQVYRDQAAWTRMSILNAARCGYFSSDRTILQYNDDLWQAPRLPIDIEPALEHKGLDLS